MRSILVRFAPGAALIVAILAFARLVIFLRARAMRALASRLGFQYKGSDLPDSIRMPRIAAWAHVRSVSNVIEGQRGGMPILIFDSIIGAGKGTGQYCTFIACKTDQNLFGPDISPEKLMQFRGWTAIYRIKYIQSPGSISIARIERYLSNM